MRRGGRVLNLRAQGSQWEVHAIESFRGKTRRAKLGVARRLKGVIAEGGASRKGNVATGSPESHTGRGKVRGTFTEGTERGYRHELNTHLS